MSAGDIALTRPRPRRVQREQIVLVARPAHPRLVKRVAGVGGDRVEMEAGRLRVNGVAVDGCDRIPGPTVVRWTVPPGRYFVVGDNSAASDDSRSWPDPFVRHDEIAGVVLSWRRRGRGPRGREASPARRRRRPGRPARGV